MGRGNYDEMHACIKKEYPRHEPLHVMHNNGKHAVVSAFDRSVGRKKVYHVLKMGKQGWEHQQIETNLWDANQHSLKEGFLPRKTHGPRARQPVMNGVKVLRRPRGLTKPTSLRNRQMLSKDREQHRARLGGRKNAGTSVAVARWNNLANKWFEKGRVENMNEVDMKKLDDTNKALAAKGFAPRSVYQQHMLDTQGHLYKKPEMPKVTASGVAAAPGKETFKSEVIRKTVHRLGIRKKKETLKQVAVRSFIRGILGSK